MPKSNEEALPEFKSLVNMTIPSLEEWLKTSDSKNTGWTADGGSGEAVGHESGRKIVKILGKLEKDEEGGELSEEDWAHVRKVVGYVKRHLAQESAGDNDKSDEELMKTKSYASLKNWGHDFIQARDEKKGGTKKSSPAKAKAGEKRKVAPKEIEEKEADDDGDAEGEVEGDEEEDAAEEEAAESNDEEEEEVAEEAAQEEEEEAAEKAKEEPVKKKARVDEAEEGLGEGDEEGVAKSTRSHD